MKDAAEDDDDEGMEEPVEEPVDNVDEGERGLEGLLASLMLLILLEGEVASEGVLVVPAGGALTMVVVAGAWVWI